MGDGSEAGRIALKRMTREMYHALYRGFQRDPDTYTDMRLFEPFVYDPEWVERTMAKQESRGNVVFAILRGGAVVGEIMLKDIDRGKRVCALSVHLQSDAVKNQGIGTQAERLALRYAFEELGMETVLADAARKNARSRHVLEKVGFRRMGEDDTFVYYRCDRRGETQNQRRDDT